MKYLGITIALRNYMTSSTSLLKELEGTNIHYYKFDWYDFVESTIGKGILLTSRVATKV